MGRIGILHPGEMGVSIAASVIHNSYRVYWMSQGRSDKTRARAEKYHLIEIDSLVQFCQTCDMILSVCPPHAAEEVARSVLEAEFKGLFLDANAISPQRAIEIEHMLKANNIRFVDGGIIGGPAWMPKETYLYLSGKHAEEIARCFINGPLEIRIIGDEIGKASALKMCYAAYSKGTTALLAAILVAAESLEVRDELYELWDMDNADFSEQANRRTARVTAKAWRFEGEMLEIAATFQNVGLPGGFHEAASEIYHRMAGFKDSPEVPSLDLVLKSLFKG